MTPRPADERTAATEGVRRVLDAFTDHICVLDEAGQIVAVNRAWQDFAAQNPPLAANAGVGANYFTVCQTAAGKDSPLAKEALDGLQAVARGELAELFLEHPCHSPDTQRWFEVRPGVEAFGLVEDLRRVWKTADPGQGATFWSTLSPDQGIAKVGS